MRRYIPLLLIICLQACTYHDYSITVSDDYFPLHVGDTWEYTAIRSGSSTIVLTQKVISKEVLGGQSYFMVVRQRANGMDTIYWRISSNGFVHSRTKNDTQESNPFRLGASIGEEWDLSPGSMYDGKMKFSAIGDIDINQARVNDCKQFYYDVEGMADEEYSVYLAPGLGMVREISAWGLGWDLKRAVINGKSIEL